MKRLMISVCILLLFLPCLQLKRLFASEIHQPMIFDEEDEKGLYISGFIDLQYLKWNYRNSKENQVPLLALVNENGTFSQNLFNIYFTFNAGKNLLAFAEIKFLYAPAATIQTVQYDMDGDGNIDPGIVYTFPYNNSYIDTQAAKFQYGSICIERAYAEWNALSYATIRFGRYLTPFGIWSQDHGAPVITSMKVPFLVSYPLPNVGMPQSQTGVELLGRFFVNKSNLIIDYAVYVGNGVSNADSTVEPGDKNKAVGGFLNLSLLSINNKIDIDFGCSAYRGEQSILLYKGANVSFIPSNDLSMINTNFSFDSSLERYSVKQMETAALVHIRISINSLPVGGTFVLQGEGMRQWIEEKDDDRLVDPFTKLHIEADNYTFDVYYIQAEYQFWGMITPYFRYEWGKIGASNPQPILLYKNANVYTAGLNVKPVPNFTVKCEWYRLDFSNPFNVNNDVDVYQTSVTLNF